MRDKIWLSSFFGFPVRQLSSFFWLLFVATANSIENNFYKEKSYAPNLWALIPKNLESFNSEIVVHNCIDFVTRCHFSEITMF